MKTNLIDSQDGRLQLATTHFVSKQTTPEEIISFFGKDNLKFRDMNNGWKHYVAWNIHLQDSYLCFTFFFEHEELKMIDFIVGDEPITMSSWDEWSEKDQLTKRDYYDNWLTNEIGDERKFPWGTIGAYYDSNGGGSGIVVKYA